MTNEVTKKSKAELMKDGKKEIKSLLSGDAFAEAMKDILPKTISAERMVRVALNCLQKTPKLALCDKKSFFNCMLTLSQYGLEPDGRLAHLIPRENRKLGTVECTLMIDYKGIVEMLMRSGKVQKIHSELVCENDEFEFNMGEVVSHRIDFRKPRGEIYACWCCVTMKDGSKLYEVMSKDDLESVRERSMAKNSGPWVTDWGEMAKKTVFRRLSKWCSISPELNEIFMKEDEQNGQNGFGEKLAEVVSSNVVEKKTTGAIGAKRRASASNLLSAKKETKVEIPAKEPEELAEVVEDSGDLEPDDELNEVL